MTSGHGLLAEGHCFRTQVLHLCKVDRRSVEAEASSRFESGTFETLVRLVDAGVGLTLLPELVVQALPEKVRCRQVRGFAAPVPARQVSFVFGRVELRGAIADALVTTLLSCLPESTIDAGGAAEGWSVVPVT